MFPKQTRVADKTLLNEFKGSSCAICGKTDGTVGHHIKTRGSGGGDVRKNLIALCPVHHNEVHSQGASTFNTKYDLENKGKS